MKAQGTTFSQHIAVFKL